MSRVISCGPDLDTPQAALGQTFAQVIADSCGHHARTFQGLSSFYLSSEILGYPETPGVRNLFSENLRATFPRSSSWI